jgi:hypothetical protein
VSAVRDEDGIPLKSGDHITFSFGTPLICVLARLSTIKGDLYINFLHPIDVTPKQYPLKELMRYYQVWKAHPWRVAAYHKDYSIGRSA